MRCSMLLITWPPHHQIRLLSPVLPRRKHNHPFVRQVICIHCLRAGLYWGQFSLPWGSLILYVLSTIRLFWPHLLEELCRTWPNRVHSEDSKASDTGLYLTQSVDYFSDCSLAKGRMSVVRSRCMFSGYVAQVEQSMLRTDETEKQE